MIKMFDSGKCKKEQNSIEDRIENESDSRSIDPIDSLLKKGVASNFLGGIFEVVAIYGSNNWENTDYALYPTLIGGCFCVYGFSRIYKAYRQMRKTNP